MVSVEDGEGHLVTCRGQVYFLEYPASERPVYGLGSCLSTCINPCYTCTVHTYVYLIIPWVEGKQARHSLCSRSPSMERKCPEVFSGCCIHERSDVIIASQKYTTARPSHLRALSQSRGVDTISGLGLDIDLGFSITAWLLALLPRASLGARLPTAPAYLLPLLIYLPSLPP